jgi:allophanate hydrolase subunit 1
MYDTLAASPNAAVAALGKMLRAYDNDLENAERSPAVTEAVDVAIGQLHGPDLGLVAELARVLVANAANAHADAAGAVLDVGIATASRYAIRYAQAGQWEFPIAATTRPVLAEKAKQLLTLAAFFGKLPEVDEEQARRDAARYN